ncbi:MAG: type II toxin-antitoxin system RelE/ParE family toxin [Gemmataceae bacterium]
MTIHVLAAAQLEAVDAADWYDDQSPGRGQQFLTQVRATIARIAAHPRAFSRVPRPPRGYDVREVMVDRFFWKITYAVIGGDVRVLSVTHSGRRSQPWRRRLP